MESRRPIDATPALYLREHVFFAEWMVLADLDDSDRGAASQRYQNERRFAEIETASARRLKAWTANPRERTQRFRVQAMQDFDSYFIPALIAADISTDELQELGGRGLEALVSSVPSLFVLTELRRLRYANAAQDFRRTDLNDIRALSVAIPYCDIVVTDKAWASLLRRSDLPERWRTHVFTSVRELAAHLGL